MWKPKQRDYAAELAACACATNVPAKHPLQEAADRIEAAQKKEDEAAEAAAKGEVPPKQPEEIDDPLGGSGDPLSGGDPLGGGDPLSDPLSSGLGSSSTKPTAFDPLAALGDPLGLLDDPLGGTPQAKALDVAVVALAATSAPQTGVEENARRTWRDRRAMILKQYAATGSLAVNQDILDSSGGAAAALGSNIDEAGPSGEKKVSSNLDSKTRGRLEQLEAAAAVEAGRTVRLTQSELVARVDRLNADLRAAWRSEERVRALKISIQVSKMLGDTSFPTFFPTVFAVVAEILDSFGELVYERVLQKGTPPGKTLPPGYTPSEITEEGAHQTAAATPRARAGHLPALPRAPTFPPPRHLPSPTRTPAKPRPLL